VRWLAIFALMQAGAAQAAPEGFPALPAPQACEGLATAIKADCSVEHLYRCPGGLTLSVDREPGDTGPVREYRTTPLTALAFAMPDEGIFGLIDNATPVLDLSDLTPEGRIEQTGDLSVWTPIFVQPYTGSFRGGVVVAGPARSIDGVDLVPLRMDMAISLNGGLLAVDGVAELHADLALGLVFTGTTILSLDTEPSPDQTPVRLIFPGEAGFLQDPGEGECLMVGALAPVLRGV
jgi:hypothetical protein